MYLCSFAQKINLALVLGHLLLALNFKKSYNKYTSRDIFETLKYFYKKISFLV